MSEEPKQKKEFDIDDYLDGKADAAHNPKPLSTSDEYRPYRLGSRILIFLGISIVVTLVIGSIFFMYAMGASMSAGTGSAGERTFMKALIYSYPVIIVVSGFLTFRR
jgi:hypothetical protein